VSDRRALERHELQTLLRVGRPIDRAVTLLMYDLALRAGEVSKLSWEDIEAAPDGYRIRVPRLKDGRQVYLGISKVTLDTVAAATGQRKGKMFRDWKQQRVRNWLRYLAMKAKLPNDKHYSHILRRSRATHMLADGATLQEVMWQLGHRSVTTTIIYLGVTEETQARARAVAAHGVDSLLH
jgi:integrase/recombinase XerD